MQSKLIRKLKEVTAIVLIVTMITPYTAFAVEGGFGDFDPWPFTEELSQFAPSVHELPELAPFSLASRYHSFPTLPDIPNLLDHPSRPSIYDLPTLPPLPDLPDSVGMLDYAGAIERAVFNNDADIHGFSHFDDFDWPEPDPYIYLSDIMPCPYDPLAPLDPETLAMVLAQYDYQQCPYEQAAAEFIALLERAVNFSGLTEYDRALIWGQLRIAYDAVRVASDLFVLMERDGYTLAESVELMRIISGGLFNYAEAQRILTMIPCADERTSEIIRMEQFAQMFDMSEEVNSRRLVYNPFIWINNAEEMATAHPDGRNIDTSDILTPDRPYTQYSFIERAQELEWERLGIDPGDMYYYEEYDPYYNEHETPNPDENPPWVELPHDEEYSDEQPPTHEEYPPVIGDQPPVLPEYSPDQIVTLPPIVPDVDGLEPVPTTQAFNHAEYFVLDEQEELFIEPMQSPFEQEAFPFELQQLPPHNAWQPPYDPYHPPYNPPHTPEDPTTDPEDDWNDNQENAPEEMLPPQRPTRRPRRRGNLSLDNAVRTRRWAAINQEEPEHLEYTRPLSIAFTNESAFAVARQLFLDNHGVSEIQAAFALGAALEVEPQTFMLPPGVYRATSAQMVIEPVVVYNAEIIAPPLFDVPLMQHPWDGDTSDFYMSHEITEYIDHLPEIIQPTPPTQIEIRPPAMRYAFEVGQVLDVIQSDTDELDQVLEYGRSIMAFGIAPMSTVTGPTLEDIRSNPFNLHFNADDSVNINTGASVFRTNILTLPGRNGFDLVLDLVYDSSDADIMGGPCVQSLAAVTSPKSRGLGSGWRFDLPYIHNNALLYVPGRGHFPLTGDAALPVTMLTNHSNDMAMSAFTGFTSGTLHTLQSNRSLTFLDGTVYFFRDSHIIGKRDRFGNTIRFEYTGGWVLRSVPGSVPGVNVMVPEFIGQLTGIVDSNGLHINFNLGSTVTTITSPDGGVFTINMSGAGASSSGIHFNVGGQVTSIRNQVEAVTRFTYSEARYYVRYRLYDFWGNPTFENRARFTMLLRWVTYPSGARLEFNYNWFDINPTGPFGTGRLHEYRVTVRTLVSNGRRYMRTTFDYWNNSNIWAPPPMQSLIATTTVTQNNGLRTVYTFNYRHLNTEQRTYNGTTLLSVQTQIYCPQRRLPTNITLTEHRQSFSRTTIQLFFYNTHGQVTRAVSPLSRGNNYDRYATSITYDSRFGLPLTTTFMTDANTTIREVNRLSIDGRRIAGTDIYQNNVRLSRTNFLHDTHGNVTEIREFPNPNGAAFYTTRITYDRGTRPIHISTTGAVGAIDTHLTYDTMWRITSKRDPNGNVTVWGYDRIGRVTQITHPGGGRETFAYNDTSNVLTHRTILGATYSYRYDGLGNLLSISVGGVVIQNNVYDDRMRLASTINAPGIDSSGETRFFYDNFDRVRQKIQMSRQGADLELGMMAFGVTIFHNDVSNANGDRRTETLIHNVSDEASISISTTIYDRFGRRIQEGNLNGKRMHYEHDKIGRVTREYSLGVDNSFTHNIHGITSITNNEGNTARNTFDGMGRKTSSTDFRGNTQRFVYDGASRLIRHYVPFERVGTTTHYSLTRYTYDGGGNLTHVATQTNLPGAPQETWSTTVNVFRDNRLTRTQTGTGPITEYTYDAAGNVRTKRVGGATNATNAATTTFAYDNRGRLISITDALGGAETFTYDANSLLLTRVDRNGTTFRKRYDSVGRLVEKQAVRNGVVVDSRGFTYARTGVLTLIRNHIGPRGPSNVINFFYDDQLRVIRELETGGIDRRFTYNEADNITRIQVYAEGVRIQDIEYTYDIAQRVHTVTSSGVPMATYTYDANGNRTGVSGRSCGLQTSYTYNLANLITNINHFLPRQTIAGFRYTHFLDGNVRQVIETSNRTITYTYDTARRLIREEAVGYRPLIREFGFDNRGNRNSMVVLEGSRMDFTSYTYNLNNQLLEEFRMCLTVGNQSTTQFLYDRNGNLEVVYCSISGLEIRHYNVFNELTRRYSPGGNSSYIYRADGLRSSKVVGGVTTQHVWSRGQVVADMRARAVIGNYIRCITGELIRCPFNGTYVHDARGDVRVRSSGLTSPGQTYRYCAFGVEISPRAGNVNPFRFGGMYWDGHREEHMTPNRSYNPRLGRWTQPDPYWNIHNMQSSTNAILQAGNLYVYTINNPVRWIDPTGLVIQLSRNENERMNTLSYLQMLTRDELSVSVEQGRFGRNTYTVSYTPMDGTDLAVGTQLIRDMINHKHTTRISLCDGDSNILADHAWNSMLLGVGSGSTIFFNPIQEALPYVADWSMGVSRQEQIPHYIILGHELIHALRMARGQYLPDSFTAPVTFQDPAGVLTTEHQRMEEILTIGLRMQGVGRTRPSGITENMLRREHGHPMRVLWGRQPY